MLTRRILNNFPCMDGLQCSRDAILHRVFQFVRVVTYRLDEIETSREANYA